MRMGWGKPVIISQTKQCTGFGMKDQKVNMPSTSSITVDPFPDLHQIHITEKVLK